jgi:hypothetical protein
MRVRHGCLVGTVLPLLLTAAPAAAEPIEPLGTQLRLTQVGADGSTASGAKWPDVAYNSVRDEYLLVWGNFDAGATEIWARRLRSDGSPAGEPFQVSDAGATDPVVAYDPERDRYGVAYRRSVAIGDIEVLVQRISGDGRVIRPNGNPGGPPTQASLTPGGSAYDPEIVYRPDANGNSSPGDQWIVGYTSSADSSVYLSAVGTVTNDAYTDRKVSAMPAGGFTSFPSLAVVPGTDDLLVAWTGSFGFGTHEIWVNRVAGRLLVPEPGQAQVTTSNGTAQKPSIATDADTNRFLIAYRAEETSAEGPEIHVQRIDAGLGQIGADDQQVSAAGPPASGITYDATTPNASYHPGLRRYLVTWVGHDDGRPGFANREEELTGTVLDADGREADPQDFTISRMGAPGNTGVDFEHQTGIAAAPAARHWLAVWGSDDPHPPLGNNEVEAYGRLVGEPPAANASPAPAGTTPALTRARLVRRFRVRDNHTRVRRLAVVGATPGTRIVLRCRGRGCPRALRRRARRIVVTQSGTVNLRPFLRRARLRPGAVLEVRIVEPGAGARVERLRIRDDRTPARILR